MCVDRGPLLARCGSARRPAAAADVSSCCACPEWAARWTLRSLVWGEAEERQARYLAYRPGAGCGVSRCSTRRERERERARTGRRGGRPTLKRLRCVVLIVRASCRLDRTGSECLAADRNPRRPDLSAQCGASRIGLEGYLVDRLGWRYGMARSLSQCVGPTARSLAAELAGPRNGAARTATEDGAGRESFVSESAPLGRLAGPSLARTVRTTATGCRRQTEDGGKDQWDRLT